MEIYLELYCFTTLELYMKTCMEMYSEDMMMNGEDWKNDGLDFLLVGIVFSGDESKSRLCYGLNIDSAGYNCLEECWMNVNIECKVNKLLNILCYRTFSTSWMEKEAGKRIDRLRLGPETFEQRFLVPPTDDWSWGKNKLFNKDSLVESISRKVKPRQDTFNMDLFLRQSAINKIQLPEEPEDRKLFNPVEIPILDLLAADSDRVDSWNVPDRKCIINMQVNRGLSLQMLKQVTVKEIIVGATPSEQLKETIKWMWEQYAINQAELPTAVLSLDVEEVPGHRYDEYRLMNLIEHENEYVELALERETEELYSGVMDKNVQIPVRIMIGDGITWCLMITIKAEPKMVDNGSGRMVQTHMIRKFKVQPEILELIRTLPLVTGVGIKNDVVIIENHYSLYAGEKVEMAGFLELGALLVLAGWRAINANMPVIHAIVVGTVLNKISSCGDGTWGLPWDEIAPSLQVYCLGDVKHGHIVYNTIISVLLRDIFPDPEGACFSTHTSQLKFASWFCEWTASVVTGTEIDYRALETSRTRMESMGSLRFRTDDGSLSRRSPDRVEIMIQLVGNWPTISFGGCRYLHQARYWFTRQYQLINHLSEEETMGLFNENLSVGEIRYLTFGIPQLELVDWRAEKTAPGRGLLKYPNLPRESLCFNIQSVTPEELRREASLRDRPLKEGVLEWARFSPYRVELFFNRLESDRWFKDKMVGYYDSLRCLYHRTTDRTPPVSPTLDVELVTKAESLLENEMRLQEACKKEWIVRTERVDHLLVAQTTGWLGCLIGLENDLPRLPKRIPTWIPRYTPRLIPEDSIFVAGSSGEGPSQRKRPFKGDEFVTERIFKQRRTEENIGAKCTRPCGIEREVRSRSKSNRSCRTEKMIRSSPRRTRSRIVRLIATPERSLSPVKKDLVERAQSRRREITPFPTEVPNKIIARVLTEETEHVSFGRVTRASEKKRREEAALPKRVNMVYLYDDLQGEIVKEDESNDEWMDPDGFCHKYIQAGVNQET